ncbi:hypothetical protein QYM36_016219 [Artemia franciscana]|uniref:Uncharacterized protein n=1 Tax=Artemia franciscana TaxID=6661 RepID=A0AA88HFL7_ARTSF|nr:hypothetical protein QYM36_016219 [Artemia franciscana]
METRRPSPIIKDAFGEKLRIVESVPEGMVFNKTYGSIYSTWKSLIEEAEESIDIASFYWTLRGSDVVNDSSAWQDPWTYSPLN